VSNNKNYCPSHSRDDAGKNLGEKEKPASRTSNQSKQHFAKVKQRCFNLATPHVKLKGKHSCGVLVVIAAADDFLASLP
jgi:hypothetical protein